MLPKENIMLKRGRDRVYVCVFQQIHLCKIIVSESVQPKDESRIAKTHHKHTAEHMAAFHFYGTYMM